jgi:hypothetical protein
MSCKGLLLLLLLLLLQLLLPLPYHRCSCTSNSLLHTQRLLFGRLLKVLVVCTMPAEAEPLHAIGC